MALRQPQTGLAISLTQIRRLVVSPDPDRLVDLSRAQWILRTCLWICRLSRWRATIVLLSFLAMGGISKISRRGLCISSRSVCPNENPFELRQVEAENGWQSTEGMGCGMLPACTVIIMVGRLWHIIVVRVIDPRTPYTSDHPNHNRYFETSGVTTVATKHRT